MICKKCRADGVEMIEGCEHCLVSPQMPEKMLLKLISLCHPDKHGGSQASTEATVYLLNLRKHFDPKGYREIALERSGFHYLSHGVCKECGGAFLWYETPKGKVIPLDEDSLEPHWKACKKGKS